jgi:hypothetical protein
MAVGLVQVRSNRLSEPERQEASDVVDRKHKDEVYIDGEAPEDMNHCGEHAG